MTTVPESATQAQKVMVSTMRQMYEKGWCLGTSGSMGVRLEQPRGSFLATPSGVQKELMADGDMTEIQIAGDDIRGVGPKPSDSAAIFKAAFQEFPSIGAVCHTHSVGATAPFQGSDLHISGMEMIKAFGISNTDTLVVPIVENLPTELELVPSIMAALRAGAGLPRPAVLVRNHGLYVFGPTAVKAKIYTEVMEFLLEAMVQRMQVAKRAPSPVRRTECAELAGAKVVLLDIEGTTTPITFVKDTLFPFAADHLLQFLEQNAGNHVGRRAVEMVREQAAKEGNILCEGIGPCIEQCRQWMAADSKVSALKDLQGQIWEDGYASGELKGELYADVPAAFMQWCESGRQVSIFSSGSRKAQHLIFKYSNRGDLSKGLMYFDPQSVGTHKRDAAAYHEIALSHGITPSEGLFFTDILEEAAAARAAGWRALLVVRPGNAPLPPQLPDGLRSVTSLMELEQRRGDTKEQLEVLKWAASGA